MTALTGRQIISFVAHITYHMHVDLTLQLSKSLPAPCTASVDATDSREPSVDRVEMLTTRSSGRVAIEEAEVSDDVTVPEASTVVSADSLNRLQLPAVEPSMDEGTAAANTSDVSVSEKVAVEQLSLPEEFLEKCKEQTDELDQQPAAATAATALSTGDQLAHEHDTECQSLGDFQLEQLENIQVAIKVFLFFHVSSLAGVFV